MQRVFIIMSNYKFLKPASTVSVLTDPALLKLLAMKIKNALGWGVQLLFTFASKH